MSNENNNWGQSVAGVLIKDGKVLLARQTYGSGNGKLIIPGGYVMYNESPQDAVKREFLEEVNINIEPKEIIAIRFNTHDWYVVFSVEYISGEAQPDNNEISEVLWVDINEALQRNDVPFTSKAVINCALKKDFALKEITYEGKNLPLFFVWSS